MGNNDRVLYDERTRLCMLYDEITPNTILTISKFLLGIIKKDNDESSKIKDYKREPIILYIYSCGGNMYSAWSLIDIIEASPTPIYTVVAGSAESAAFMIYISGKKRYVMKHARLMFHQFSWNINDQYDKLRDFCHVMDDEWERYTKFVCSKTSITKAKLEEIREKKQDYWLTSEESIKYHVSDYYYDELIGGKENEEKDL